MKKYDVTLTAHYEKTISVCAESAEQAKAKTEIILFDTDLINFTDEDFICGEAKINESCEDGAEDTDEEEAFLPIFLFFLFLLLLDFCKSFLCPIRHTFGLDFS